MLLSRFSRRAQILVASSAAVVLVGGGVGVLANGAAACACGGDSQAFTNAGPATFTVPQNVSSVTIIAKGSAGEMGDGASMNGVGGMGATVTATFAVTEGEEMDVLVAQTGSYGGGGGGGTNGGEGGGGSSVSVEGDRVLVAGGGGGGGAGGNDGIIGGAGGLGGEIAGDGGNGELQPGVIIGGVRPASTDQAFGGAGASLVSPGGGGFADAGNGDDGSGASGGNGGDSDNSGGGGGGGYFGGGGGGRGSESVGGGGGGAGSSFVAEDGTNVSMSTSGSADATGSVTFSWTEDATTTTSSSSSTSTSTSTSSSSSTTSSTSSTSSTTSSTTTPTTASSTSTTTTVAPEPTTTTTVAPEPTTTTTAPAPGGGYGDDPGDASSDLTSTPGGSITVHGTNFMGNSDVTVILHSNPITLGTATTDSNGEFVQTFALPDNTPTGQHNVLLQGTDKNGNPTTVTLDLTVQASSSSLPFTGGTTMPLIFVSALLVAVGLLLARRRSRTTR